jgi:putative phosphoribosyl transferase
MAEPSASAAESHGSLWTPPPAGAAVRENVIIDVGSALLEGRIQVPPQPIAAAIVAHSSENPASPTTVFLAGILNAHRIATVVVDLVTVSEATVSDALDHVDESEVELLGSRLVRAQRGLRARPRLAGLPFGYLGIAAAAGAALWAAAGDETVSAVVAYGPRPDSAGPRLMAVTAPTLLVVGSRDPSALRRNERALAMLGHGPRLDVVPEPRYFADSVVLEALAQRAAQWFVTHCDRPCDPGRRQSGTPQAQYRH